jgi:hypothetical protein
MLRDAKVRSDNICQRVTLSNEELFRCLSDRRAREAEQYRRPFSVSVEQQVSSPSRAWLASSLPGAACGGSVSQNVLTSTATRNDAALSSLQSMLPERRVLLDAVLHSSQYHAADLESRAGLRHSGQGVARIALWGISRRPPRLFWQRALAVYSRYTTMLVPARLVCGAYCVCSTTNSVSATVWSGSTVWSCAHL